MFEFKYHYNRKCLTGIVKPNLKLDLPPEQTYWEINARAMGNPFFIEQLCAYLAEIGKLDEQGRITGELGPVASFSISDIIGSRIDRLTEQVRNCVYNASVLGMEFNIEVLSRMLNADLQSDLDLGRSNLIWNELDELRYIFSHIMIKDIAYLRILESRIRQLHLLAAEAMELVFQDALDEHAEEIGYHSERAGLVEKAAEYYDKAGCWFIKKYEFSKSYMSLSKALQIRETVLGAEHPDTALTLNYLALMYEGQGKYAEAESLHLRALEIREKTLGPEHPDTACSINNLASVYSSLGKYAEAESLYHRALEIREKVLGAEHPRTADTLNNLALLYVRQGKYAEAEPRYLRALAIMEKVLGAEHSHIANTLNNLAIFYCKQSKFAAAEPLFSKALAVREKTLGTEHPDTAMSLNNLATLHLNLGKYAEAEPLLLRALTVMEKILGLRHPWTIDTINGIIELYEKTKQPEKAGHYKAMLPEEEKKP